MIALLKKEFSLAMHPTVFIFMLFGAMLMIPSYPYYVAFYYCTLGIFFVFLTGRENNDILFTVLLPVRKRDCVTARFLTVFIIEMLQIVISVPFAILSVAVNPNEGGNAVGIEPNVAFYGLLLVMLAIFNIVFIPQFYKTGCNIGKPFMVASTLEFLFIIAAEAAVHVPAFTDVLDSSEHEMLVKQIPVLLAGIGVYIAAISAAWAVSVKRFEKVDLT